MLLQLHNSDIEGLRKLLLFATENNIELTKVTSNFSSLPGEPFTEQELEALVIKSRQSGKISAHKVSQEVKQMYEN